MHTTDERPTPAEIRAEREFLHLMMKTCRAVRDPRKRKTRTELLIPAARWEMRFESRLTQLEKLAA